MDSSSSSSSTSTSSTIKIKNSKLSQSILDKFNEEELKGWYRELDLSSM